MKSVDVRDVPELLDLAREVQVTEEPRVLRYGEEDLAIVMPIARATKRRSKHTTPLLAREAVLAAAGGWKDLIDAERLKEQLAASRGSDRPAVEL